MDNFVQNNTPKSSNVDSMIEKFSTEFKKQPETDLRNTRKLTIESPFNSNATDSSQAMDKQLTELESLIKRLQNEIAHMSNSNCGSLANDDVEEKELDTHDEDQNKRNNNSHIYHFTVKDVMKIDDQNKNVSHNNSELASSSKTQLYETFTAIRRNFSLLWDEGKVFEDEIVNKKDES